MKHKSNLRSRGGIRDWLKAFSATLHARLPSYQFVSLACLTTLFIAILGPNVEAEGEWEDQRLEFEGFEWIPVDNAALSVEFYRGHRAVRIQSRGTNSGARIKGLDLSEGRLEFDLAFTEHSPPWICFHEKGKAEPHRARFNPMASKEPATSRLYRAVLTRENSDALVVNYRQLDNKFDRARWTHISIVSTEGLTRIFIDQDETPTTVVDSNFLCGEIGIEGSCLVRNITTSAKTKP